MVDPPGVQNPKTAQTLHKPWFHLIRPLVQVCLVGRKGEDPAGVCHSVASDVIYSERRGQSQKPEEIYHLIEELVPNGAEPSAPECSRGDTGSLSIEP